MKAEEKCSPRDWVEYVNIEKHNFMLCMKWKKFSFKDNAQKKLNISVGLFKIKEST